METTLEKTHWMEQKLCNYSITIMIKAMKESYIWKQNLTLPKMLKKKKKTSEEQTFKLAPTRGGGSGISRGKREEENYCTWMKWCVWKPEGGRGVLPPRNWKHISGKDEAGMKGRAQTTYGLVDWKTLDFTPRAMVTKEWPLYLYLKRIPLLLGGELFRGNQEEAGRSTWGGRGAVWKVGGDAVFN